MRPADRILARLYDAGAAPVEPGALCEGQCPPECLEEALDELARRGHRIERSPQGVRLVRPTVLDAHLIERGLAVERIGRHVICFGEVGSTMDVAFDSACGPDEALVVTAESQRAGRGRFGRPWQCPPGSGVLASVLLPRPADGQQRPSHDALTIAAGLAVAEGVEDAAGVRAGLKWPNDVVVGGAKLAGVLVEVRGDRTVVGLGINVSEAPPPRQVTGRATCLADAAAGQIERIELCRAVLVRLDRWAAAVGAGELRELHDRWQARSEMHNLRLTVEYGRRRHTGRVIDVSPLAGLILLTDAGEHVHLPAAGSTVIAR